MHSGPDTFGEAEVWAALRVCFDAELRINVVDLGLVHAVTVAVDTQAPGFAPRFHVHISLLRRDANDEREAMLVGSINNRLLGLRQVSRSQVLVVDEPTWTPARMTAAARAQLSADLGLVRIQL